MYNDLMKKEHNNVEDFSLVDVNGVEDTVAVMCSSGTTGLPKGVMLTHVNFLTLCAHYKYYFDSVQEKKNVPIVTGLALIPWFHAYGFITTFALMAMKIRIVFLIRFEGEKFLETIQNYKINMTTIVPPLAVFLAKHPLVLKYDLSSLHEVWCGAAPLSSEIQKAVTKRTGIDFIKQGYGLTEATMACCVDLTSGEKVGSCGTPAPGMKIKVLDIESGEKLGVEQEGELWIKTPLRMKGYMGDKAASDALFDGEGYVRTGDIGYYDKDGFFYIVDRLKELIKYKGFQVAPAELEALLLQHSGVADAGVVGLPDELAGELPIAFVVPQPNSNVTEKELIEYVASKLSPAKHLRGGVIFINEIPKNASGKILRRELRTMLSKQKSKL
ncbi:luciferin 4-monooxygenase isoform X2 [Bombyx mori]